MNFIKDLRAIAEGYLKKYDLEFEASEEDRVVIDRWVNYELRIIPKMRRNVFVSKKIENMNLPSGVQQAYDKIKQKFLDGDELYPYLSKSISYEDYTDLLFCDWNIYHLHISDEVDKKNPKFMKRSDNLLFLCLNNDSAYFVDIRSHNENFVFAQKEIIEIIHKDFPEVLEPYKMKGILDIEVDLSDAQQICDLRKAGINICYKVNGDFYVPMGGGITAAKTSSRVRILVNNLYHMARDYERTIKEKEDDIKKLIKSHKPNQRSFKYKLIFRNGQYRVIEVNSLLLL